MTHRQQVTAQPLPATGFLLLASLGLFWGVNWPAMKIILGEMTVWWFRVVSVGAGAAGLLLVAWVASRVSHPRRSEVGPLLFCALFAVIGWHLCTGYGVSLMPAGRASIIAFTMPVWASILAIPVLGESMTRTKLIGLLLGLAGLGVLIGPDLVVLQTAPVGVVFMLGAAFSWAMGTVLFKRFTWHSPITALMGWQLLVGLVVIVPGALLLEPVPDFTTIGLEAWVALIYLFAVPMVYCQWAYLKVVSLFPAAIAAIGTLAVPIVGTYSSALLLDEPVGWPEFLAMTLIVSALLVVLVVPALSARGVSRPPRIPGAPWPGRGSRRTRTSRSDEPAPPPYRLKS